MRTSRDCPAGMVTMALERELATPAVGATAGVSAGAAAGAGAGAECPGLPVNVSATISVVLKV